MNLRTTTTTTPSKPPASTNTNTKSPSRRVFTDQDEIKLLKAYKKSIRNNPNSTPGSLSFRHFSQTQIRSKLKRLKEKYHTMAKSKSKIKTHQHRNVYLLGRRIWGKTNWKTPKVSKPHQGSKDGIFGDELDLNNGNTENLVGGSGKPDVDLEKCKEGNKASKVWENGLELNNGNTEKNLGENGDGLRSGKSVVDLEKFPFLMENICEEVKKIGILYFEGLKSLGKEKLKELDDNWMVLSMQKAEIETEKSLLFQKQFILVADARRRM